MANMTAVFAQLERRLIGERTKAALAMRQAQGVRLGRPVVLPASVRRRIAKSRAGGLTLRAIAEDLNQARIPTAHGGQLWYASSVRACLHTALV